MIDGRTWLRACFDTGYGDSGLVARLFTLYIQLRKTLMTYGRARLWLGITGVGSLVTLSALALIFQWQTAFSPVDQSFSLTQFTQLAGFAGLFMLWLVPFDFLGGFWLPKKFGKSQDSFVSWLSRYIPAVIGQASLFVLFGSLILSLSQLFGAIGGLIAITGGVVICLLVRNQWVVRREVKTEVAADKLTDAIALIQGWQIFVPETLVVRHNDIGFTGGIIGVGKYARIVIPESWLKFSTTQLAAAIARRAIAIESGSYRRGLVIAFASNAAGFMLCTFLPGAGLTSVAGLITTICGFTIWSFLGLLILPTVSRNASLKIDQTLVELGVAESIIFQTANEMDQLQDGEPERPAIIETIFHPVPNVASRNAARPIHGLVAWNVARTTLFFSWPCFGFLSRAVHCNVGRPELWTMLPTD